MLLADHVQAQARAGLQSNIIEGDPKSQAAFTVDEFQVRLRFGGSHNQITAFNTNCIRSRRVLASHATDAAADTICRPTHSPRRSARVGCRARRRLC